MEIVSRPSEIDSDGSLYEHCSEVASRMSNEAKKEVGVSPEAAYKIGVLHDIGKCTSFFQKELRDIEYESTPGRFDSSNHAYFGSLATLFVLWESEGVSEIECAIGTEAVARHHQDLMSTSTFPRSYLEFSNSTHLCTERYKLFVRQWKDIVSNETNRSVAERLFREAGISSDDPLTEFKEFITSWSNPNGFLETFTDPEPDLYWDFEISFSYLRRADLISSSGLSELDTDLLESRGQYFKPDQIEEYVDGLKSSESDSEEVSILNEFRERARVEATTEGVSQWKDSKGIAELRLPTGFGKTLTGLQSALELKEKEDLNSIIYCLPFTSIIDQVDEEVKSIFEGIDHKSKEYTLHHYLSETFTSAEEIDDSGGELLAELWSSELVLSTFVQLFESIVCGRKAQVGKIPSLRNSVIILDEPQSIPTEWWPTVSSVVEWLCDQFNCYILFMTATQPKLPKYMMSEDSINLLTESESYFRLLESQPRVSYNFHESITENLNNSEYNYTIEDFSDDISNHIEETNDDTLVVCNTINSVYEIANELTDKLSEEIIPIDDLMDKQGHPEIALIPLTTRIRFDDRKKAIQKAKELLDAKTQVIVISTQLIEAGVDIGFDCLFRDFAPLSSLVQAAGRCNREYGNGEVSTVNVVNLSPENGKPPSELVYGANQNDAQLRITKETLSKHLNEQTKSEYEVVSTLTDLYYDRLHSNGVGSTELHSHMKKLKFTELNKKSMISDSIKTETVFIATNKAEIQLFESLTDALSYGDYSTANQLLEEIKTKTVDVSKKEVANSSSLNQIGDLDKFWFYNAVSNSGYSIETGLSLSNRTEDQFL